MIGAYAYASSLNDVQVGVYDGTNFVDTSMAHSTELDSIMVFDVDAGVYRMAEATAPFFVQGGELRFNPSAITGVFAPISHTHNLSDINSLTDVLDTKADKLVVAAATTSLQSQINSLSSTLGGLSFTQVQSNWTQASTTAVDYIKNKPVRTFATSTRSIVTGSGATGFQVSTSSDVLASYAVNVTTTASIGGASSGYITLEIAPTNSATSTDWFEIGSRCSNAQTVTLAIILNSVQTVGCTMSGVIPSGYFAKLRSVDVSGTDSYGFVSGREVKF